jgi:hypothetical protein
MTEFGRIVLNFIIAINFADSLDIRASREVFLIEVRSHGILILHGYPKVGDYRLPACLLIRRLPGPGSTGIIRAASAP